MALITHADKWAYGQGEFGDRQIAVCGHHSAARQPFAYQAAVVDLTGVGLSLAQRVAVAAEVTTGCPLGVWQRYFGTRRFFGIAASCDPESGRLPDFRERTGRAADRRQVSSLQDSAGFKSSRGDWI
jgi:hypothetical protein